MRILHTSDWHLGIKLQNFSRLDEQKEVINEICKIAEDYNVDVFIISGDIFDNANPSEEVRKLFYETLRRLYNKERIIIAIAGNHDSPEGIETPYPLAKEFGIFLVGFPNTNVGNFETENVKVEEKEEGFIEIKFKKFDYPLRILLSPYTNEYRLRKSLNIDENEEIKEVVVKRWKELVEKYCDNKGINLLVAHALVMKNGIKIEELEDEKPIIGGIGAISPEDIPDK
ncbi:MAG: exonuclease SbcCD subunit D, partial [Candidatus Altarchaeaceae archaeon]